jgi:hypothetical protein
MARPWPLMFPVAIRTLWSALLLDPTRNRPTMFLAICVLPLTGNASSQSETTPAGCDARRGLFMIQP